MKESLLISVTIIIIFIFLFTNVQEDLKIVTIDGNNIAVRDSRDMYDGAVLLNTLISNMYSLRNILVNNIAQYPEQREYIELLANNFNRRRTKIYENSHQSNYTSYSVNKGEEFVFCLRCRKSLQLHSLNLLMYVAVHEMAHAGCPEVGHTPLFNRIFRFYLQEAVKYNLYKYENYSQSPVEYCGLRLYTNILN